MRGALAAALVLCWSPSSWAQPRSTQGRFTAVTYNVAGLPESLSRLKPVQHLPLIGIALNRYDIAFVQEDFAYPDLLRGQLRLPYQSPGFVRGQALHFGDGLSAFSRYPLADLRREAWRNCHGIFDSFSDCLTPKGLAKTTIELAPGVLVDAYNVHLDAGSAPGDVEARAAQLRQLFDTIGAWSPSAPLIVAGDFNLGREELEEFRALAGKAGLRDACDVLRCAQGWRIDRVLFKSATSLELRPRSWRVEASLRDQQGQPLSDHLAVVVGFDWRVAKGAKIAALNADSKRPLAER